MRFIRTKIIATVGPASASRDVIDQLVEAGCDCFRINFSHGSDEQRGRFLETIRDVETTRGEVIPVIADLCGPKIRVGMVADGEMNLADGSELIIQKAVIEGRDGRISTTFEELVDEVEPGQPVLLDDGKLRLEVIGHPKEGEVACRVIRGGILRSGKGINLPQAALKVSAITERDRCGLDWIAKHDIDYVALSFVRSAADVLELRRLLEERGSAADIISKIEKPQALADIDAIIEASDAVMVARGDLGVEMDLPSVPVAQKRIARKCQAAGKPCIIATQMLETMTDAPSPTRAEVSDVANAVLDLADAVMLSGETAAGQFPVEAVSTMNDIVASVEAYHDEVAAPLAVSCGAQPVVAALAAALRQVIATCGITAIGTYTATGTTARMLSKSRLARPILAMSPSPAAVRRMGLYYGVVPVLADNPKHTRVVLALAGERLVAENLASPGDLVAIVSGRPICEPGATNTLVVHKI